MPHPFSFELPSLSVSRGGEEKKTPPLIEMPLRAEDDFIKFSAFTNFFNDLEDGPVRQFLTQVEPLMNNPDSATGVSEAHNEIYLKNIDSFTANPQLVESVLTSLLSARARIVEALHAKQTRTKEEEVQILLSESKRIKYMVHTMICLQESLLLHPESIVLRCCFIQFLSEDLNRNQHNIAQGALSNYFSPKQIQALEPIFYEKQLEFCIYSFLEDWAMRGQLKFYEVDELFPLLEHPILFLQQKAAFSLALGRREEGLELLKASEKQAGLQWTFFIKFVKAKENVLSLHDNILLNIKEAARATREEAQSNKQRIIYSDILEKLQKISESPLKFRGNVDNSATMLALQQRLITGIKNVEDLSQKEIEQIHESIGLLSYMLMIHCENNLASFHSCLTISGYLKELFDAQSNNLIAWQISEELDSYIGTLRHHMRIYICSTVQNRPAVPQIMESPNGLKMTRLKGKKQKQIELPAVENPLKQELDRYKTELGQAAQEKAKLQGKIQHLHDTQKSTDKKHKAEEAQFKETIAELEAKLIGLEASLVQATRPAPATIQPEVVQKLEALKAENQTLKEKEASFESQRQAMRTKHQQRKAKLSEDFSAELQAAKDGQRQITLEGEQLKKDKTALQSEIENIKQKATAELNTLSNANTELTEQNQALRVEAALKKQVEAELTTLKAEKEADKQRFAQLEADLSKLQAQKLEKAPELQAILARAQALLSSEVDERPQAAESTLRTAESQAATFQPLEQTMKAHLDARLDNLSMNIASILNGYLGTTNQIIAQSLSAAPQIQAANYTIINNQQISDDLESMIKGALELKQVSPVLVFSGSLKSVLRIRPSYLEHFLKISVQMRGIFNPEDCATVNECLSRVAFSEGIPSYLRFLGVVTEHLEPAYVFKHLCYQNLLYPLVQLESPNDPAFITKWFNFVEAQLKATQGQKLSNELFLNLLLLVPYQSLKTKQPHTSTTKDLVAKLSITFVDCFVNSSDNDKTVMLSHIQTGLPVAINRFATFQAAVLRLSVINPSVPVLSAAAPSYVPRGYVPQYQNARSLQKPHVFQPSRSTTLVSGSAAKPNSTKQKADNVG